MSAATSQDGNIKALNRVEADELVVQLVSLLDGGQAHATFEQAVDKFPAELRGTVPQHLPYSAWQLLEHMRIALNDILLFSANYDGSYKSPKWPDGYWTEAAAPPSDAAWANSIHQVHADLLEFKKLLQSGQADIFAAFPWGDGQNLLREALLIADHNAYHVGEMIVLRRLFGAWPAAK